MPIQTGAQLAHYRLIEQIGEGGMGVVWRATDTALDREVAVKLLPEGLASDAERLQRFEREAKLLASLNHPHIATIHGLHEAPSPDPDGSPVRFLAMELVEGEDLLQRIERGAIPLERTVEIAGQIASALEAAHSHGVVHRDLKPANIRLTADGQVKVLDFGLAKALSADPLSTDAGAGPTMSPTMTSAGTLAGMILGTAAYMSPEQARGKSVDKRADLWAFGSLLYEMLSGRRLFGGETISDTLASVLKEQPDWSRLPADTPPAIRRLLRRCLAKDPRQRLSDAGDARLELAEALEGPPPNEQTLPGPVEATPAPVRAQALPWLVAVAAVLLAAAAWLLGARNEERTLEPLSLSVPLSQDVTLDDGEQSTLALSPDGRFLVFTGISEAGSSLYLKKMDRPGVVPLDGTRNAVNPFFSPDSRWVAFFAEEKLKKISVDGGAPITICDTSGTPRGASWGDDDLIVFPRHFDSGLLQVSGSGGKASPLTELDEAREERTHRWPQIVPGRGVVLFTVATLDSPEYYDDAIIEALRLDTGERKTVYEGASFARYLDTGHLVLGREGFLFAVPFDIDKLEVAGTPVPVVEGVMGARSSGVVYASFARNGLLAYVAGVPRSRQAVLARHFPDGRSERIPGAPVDAYIGSSVSPDGKRIAVAIAAEGAFNIWIYDVERENFTRLTFEGSSTGPRWTPDGESVLYYSVRDGKGAAYTMAADGSGKERLLHSAEGVTLVPDDVSPDGRLAVLTVYGESRADLHILPLADPDAQALPFVTGPSDELQGRFSPDGRWIAYSSDETGDYEIFVRPHPGPGGRWQVSKGGGVHPRWSRDGKQLHYRSGRRWFVADVAAGEGDSFRVGTPRLLRSDLTRAPLVVGWDLSADGRSAVLAVPADGEGPPEQITVVVNWSDQLKGIQGPR